MLRGTGDDTHNKKQTARRYKNGQQYGEISMEKPILVTDKTGRSYPPTYLRRANGLVKNGRAYWIDAQARLCLLCPPIKMEDTFMLDTEILELNALEGVTTAASGCTLGKDEILTRIDAIIAGNSHLHDGFESINRLGDCEGMAEKTTAISDIVKAREATNQKLIALLEKML